MKRFIYFFLVVSILFSLSAKIKSINKKALEKIDVLVQKEIEAGHFPGAVICIGQNNKILYLKSFGYMMIKPAKKKMKKDTIFDLASLTKPIATATSIMILIQEGKIKLDDYVVKYIPEFGKNGKNLVQIKHLLTHTSGLPPYLNVKKLEERAKVEKNKKTFDILIEAICNTKPRSKPGEKFKYSCLGYITLAKIIEVVTGKTIKDFAEERIFKPLGMNHTCFCPPKKWYKNIAATQIINGKPLIGVVHDPLARFAGGISGNAGLFSNARDLAKYAQMLLNNGYYKPYFWSKKRRLLTEKSIYLLTHEQIKGRAYGFDVSSGYSWIKGKYAPKGTFCHSGYTGTSIVCDPTNKIFIIILTNRVHPYDKGTVKNIRKSVANIVFTSLK